MNTLHLLTVIAFFFINSLFAQVPKPGKRLIYYWNGASYTTPKDTMFYTYNEKGNLIASKFKYYKTKIFYDEEGRDTLSMSGYLDGSESDIIYKETNKYVNNKLVNKKNWSTGPSWTNAFMASQIINEYDENGRLIKLLKIVYDMQNNSTTKKTVYLYNEIKENYKTYNLKYNETEGPYDSISMTENYYKGHLLTNSLIYNYSLSAIIPWKLASRTTYLNENLSNYITETYKDGVILDSIIVTKILIDTIGSYEETTEKFLPEKTIKKSFEYNYIDGQKKITSSGSVENGRRSRDSIVQFYSGINLTSQVRIMSEKNDSVVYFDFQTFLPTSVSMGILPNPIMIYPHPVKDRFLVNSEIKIKSASYILRNSLGIPLIQDEFNYNNEIDISNVNSGIYFLEIISENSKYMKKLIKE